MSRVYKSAGIKKMLKKELSHESIKELYDIELRRVKMECRKKSVIETTEYLTEQLANLRLSSKLGWN